MNPPATRNVPTPTTETAEFWAATRRHELLLQHCACCGHHQFYPRVLCTACAATDLCWVQAKGQGTVRSFTVVHRAVSAAYAAQCPFVLALIALDEGPTMMSTLTDCRPDEIAIGLRVNVMFDDWPEGVTLPVFSPVEHT